ncbi:MAG: serine hydrolase domain-containing protein [Blastocatellia bacterium]
MKRLLFLLSPVVLLLAGLALSPVTLVSHGRSADPVLVAPESVGMSGARLINIRAKMNEHVAAKKIPGASGLISRRGKVTWQDAWGMADIAGGRPMQMDTIHRIYSMSKPITSVALLMLYEEGKFQLNDPIAKYMPEFARMTVGVEEKDPATGQMTFKTVPARRMITVRDLLRHTAGLTYGVFGDTPVDKAYRQAGILSDLTLQAFASNLAKMPLQYEPGTRWHYSVSVDLQGRLVEVLSGKPFDKFLQERIFTPLGMVDTGFFVPAEKKNRFAKLYTQTKTGVIEPMPLCAAREDCLAKFPNVAPSMLEIQGMLSGGGGLVSTTYDYLRFCQMLLNKGTHEGTRLLGRKTVELMTSDHLGAIPGMSAGNGFGLGFSVNKAPGEAGMMGSPGEYNWGGAAGTKFWIDPKEELIGIYMIQILPHTGLEYGSEFRVLTYQAIAD